MWFVQNVQNVVSWFRAVQATLIHNPKAAVKAVEKKSEVEYLSSIIYIATRL